MKVVNVKSKGKISSIFMAFLENMNFKIKTNFHSKITSQNIVRKGHKQVLSGQNLPGFAK